jgi:hypothetical protein
VIHSSDIPVLGRAIRRRRMDGASPPGPPAPFIVGVGRSGTTLLRLMLDTHPELTIPPETHFVPALMRECERWRATPEKLLRALVNHPEPGWQDLALDADDLLERWRAIEQLKTSDVVRAVYEAYAEREGKPRWGDKTPRYVRKMGRIHRALPEARFIHLIRDGRDVALSTKRRMESWNRPKAVAIEGVAKRWRARILNARHTGERLGGHYTEMRYESLVRDPEAELRRVCQVIELDYDPVMLSYYERAAKRLEEINRDLDAKDGAVRPASERLAAHAMTTKPPSAERLEVWRREMDEAEVRAFETVAGDLLADLGYETLSDAPPLLVGRAQTG